MVGSQTIAAGAALSAFSVGAQNDRLLRLDFPQKDGPDSTLLPNRMTAHEEVSRCFRFEVELLSDDARIPLKAMMGRMVTMSLVRDDGSLRYFNGYVTTFRFLRTYGGFAFYQMVLEPWLAFTKLRKDNVSFHGKSVLELTELTFKHYIQADWRVHLVGEDPRVTYANQYNETDYNHLHRRWEAFGLMYWYEHRANGHTLWLADKSTLAQIIDPNGIDDSGEILFRDKAGSLEHDGIRAWSPVRTLGSGHTTLASFDYKNPIAQRSTATSRNKQGDVFAHEVYENTGSYGFRTHREGELLAQQRMDERDASTQTFDARGNDRTAQPGRYFTLAGHFSAELQPPKYGEEPHASIARREYLILSVDHEVSNNYQAGSGAPSDYENRFRCMRNAIQWRPGRNYNSQPCTYPGVQTALVVGPEGTEIHTDGYGRIKIQFHWDRLGKYDENSSPWLRVMAPGAGSQFGNIRLPRVGEEVAVVFVDGNIDHPMILGVLYNEMHMPPWQLPGQRALSGLRSRELQGGGGKRGNHLVLDDTAGKIQAQLKSDHQCSQLSLGHITRVEDTQGRKDARGEGWELRTDGHGVARAARGMLITTEARQDARGAVKEMDETTHRLALAAEQHQLMAEIAQKNGAQELGENQDDVASALQIQLDAVRGKMAKGGSFPELDRSQLVLASPAGIATTTAGDTHIASDQHTAITTGKSLSLAAGANFFASVRQSFGLFVQKAGMKMVAAAGDIDVRALSDSINLLAKLDVTQTANRITISAKEEIVINGGGSYVKFTAGGIEHGTNGSFVAHAVHHSLVNAKNMDMAVAMPPITDVLRKGRAALHLGSHAEAAGRMSAGLPFKLFKDGALVEQGQVDEQGNIRFAHELDTTARYKLELPTGQSFDVVASAYAQQHEINAGVGYHGYENPGGILTDDEVSLDQDRVDANPWSSRQI